VGQDVDQGQIAERGVVGQFVGNGHDKTSFLSVIYLYLIINDISIYPLFLFFKRILGDTVLLQIKGNCAMMNSIKTESTTRNL
jgi:hypothetical protein